MFCPLAGGPCQGRSNCRLWVRGRILNTDSKLLAAQLARFLVQEKTILAQSNPKNSEFTHAFWQSQGLADIHREVIIDRYLAEKVREVEDLANRWAKSPGFLKTLVANKTKSTKESPGLRKQRCKSPP